MRDKQAVLSRVEFEEVAEYFPPVEPLVFGDETIDVFICALGFEQRALAIPGILSRSVWHQNNLARQAVICSYTTNHEENEANRERLQKALRSFCAETTELPGDHPGDLAQQLRQELTRVQPPNRPLHVVFDISAASGNLIMSVMYALVEHAANHRLALTVGYSEPAEYFPSEESYQEGSEELVLSAYSSGDDSSLHEHGVSEVEINELYPGESQENRQEYIIAIPSYRTGRLARCLQRLSDEPLADPDQFIHWVLGVPPAEERRWRLDLQSRVVRRLLTELAGHESERSHLILTPENHSVVSTLDYRQLMKLMFQRVDDNLGKNVSVVHMGSKLQALGVSLALAARTEVTVCFAKPARYNAAQYSTGLGAAWQVQLPDVGEVVSSARKIGTLRFIPRTEPERPGLHDD